jgi:hypothetical protein
MGVHRRAGGVVCARDFATILQGTLAMIHRHAVSRGLPRLLACLSVGLSACLPVQAQPAPKTSNACEGLQQQLSQRLKDIVCFDSPDLTTHNTTAPPTGPTTPANDSLPGLPPFAFTPASDAALISPSPGKRAPITKTVPGIQLQARLADDPTGQGRIVLRLPKDWNGGLIVAGASGTRSEFNSDMVWSDFVLQKGYAYASQNKGVYNLRLSTADDPLACRLNPTTPVYVHFYANDADQPFTRWADAIVDTARLARDATRMLYGHQPRHLYAVGVSNGGHQVRRAIESAPQLFDGGIDWEGTYIDSEAPNILTHLAAALKHWPDYAASGFDPNSLAAARIREAGYPPDIVVDGKSFWGQHLSQFWEVTMCQWQKRFDPAYDTYGAGLSHYDFAQRVATTDVALKLKNVANTGRVLRPLITVAGTMDALLPAELHARAYARKVAAVSKGKSASAPYRLYEVQNGNHVESNQDLFPQLALIEPHAHRAFELLVRHVEDKLPLPPDQCIAKGGRISETPSADQAGLCKALLVP